MQFFIFLTLIFSTSLASCVTVRPAQSIAEMLAVSASGDLPEINGFLAFELQSNAKIPALVVPMSKNCGDPCATIKRALAKASANADGRYLVAIVDSDQSNGLSKKFSRGGYPFGIIYEGGKQRWIAYGEDEILLAIKVLKEAPPNYEIDFRFRSSADEPKNPKIFLISAMSTPVSFTQEIVDQRKYWRSQGFSDDDIACYWSAPHFGRYWEARERLQQLLPDLKGCYMADLSLIHEHWTKSAAHKPKSMYLYVTSHGIHDTVAKQTADQVKERFLAETVSSACSELSSAHLVFDNYRDRIPAQVDHSVLFGTACSGKGEEFPVFNKNFVAQLLKSTVPETRKIMVIQGCYSGAMVPDKLPDHTTVMTAADAERASFGCNVDGIRTEYGAQYLHVLKNSKPSLIESDDWKQICADVCQRIGQQEAMKEYPSKYRSLPTCFSN